MGSKFGAALAITVCFVSSSSSSGSESRKMVIVLELPLMLEETGLVVGIVEECKMGVPTAFKAESHKPHGPSVGLMLVVAGTEEGVIPGTVRACR